jgi:hypothetical protein
MAFKLIEAAQDRWRAVNGPHLVALVRAGATFVNGKLVERPDETLWVPRTPSPHATCTYSWMRPPSRSRRIGRMAVPERGGVPLAGGR